MSKGVIFCQFYVHIERQCRQGWVGLPSSGLLIKLITMVTGREKSSPHSYYLTQFFLMDLKAQRGKHLPDTEHQQSLCHLNSSLKSSHALGLSNQKPQQPTLLDKSHCQKAALSQKAAASSSSSFWRKWCEELPSVHVHQHCCQKRSATSWTRMLPGRSALARCVMESQEGFQD